MFKIKILLSYFFPVILLANLTYETNSNKELNILDAFDINPSFLYDPIMNEMRAKNSSYDKNTRFFKTMNDAYIFIPAIKSTLAKYNIPQEFLYLAMAESNFRTHAYSKKRAAGLWQFMPETGRYYGLKIDEYVDERRDLIKSTEAAAEYLSALHKRFGKWYLAAIAYNCGGGRLNQAIQKAKSDDLAVLLDPKKKYIPRESRFYIRKIVALALIGGDEQYLLSSEYEYLLNRASAYTISTIKLPRGESLRRVAKILDMPYRDLKKLNRHLKYDFTPPYSNSYEIYIPYIKLTEFKQKYHEAPMSKVYRVHRVSKGENLSYIGKKYGVSYRVIKDFNKLRSNRVNINQKLIIPINKNSKQAKLSSKHYYIVKKGDSLHSISKAHKVSVQNIKLQNRLKGTTIRVGERLKIYE